MFILLHFKHEFFLTTTRLLRIKRINSKCLFKLNLFSILFTIALPLLNNWHWHVNKDAAALLTFCYPGRYNKTSKQQRSVFDGCCINFPERLFSSEQHRKAWSQDRIEWFYVKKLRDQSEHNIYFCQKKENTTSQNNALGYIEGKLSSATKFKFLDNDVFTLYT